jgi:hypothetical protein
MLNKSKGAIALVDSGLEGFTQTKFGPWKLNTPVIVGSADLDLHPLETKIGL